ncbi:hypothetical protein HFP66_00225 [Bacillus sp. A17A.1]
MKRELVVNQDSVTAITLYKDQLYPLLVEYRANADQVGTGMPPLQLYWSYNNGDILSIPDENILQPNSSTDVTYENGTDTNLFQFQNIISNGKEFVVDASGAAPAPDEKVDESLDTDGDRIPNILEQKGWTYNPLTAQVSLWDSEKDKDRPKYVTNPILYSTTGDPFSDLQHVNSNMAGENGKSSEVTRVDETHHPLVAIFPSIRVHILGFIMASNGKVTTGQQTQNSTTVASSNMTSKTTQWDIHGEYHLSGGFPLGVQAGWSVGGGYGQSNTNSSTAEFSRTGSNTTHDDFTYQASQAANIGFVVQYENIGTAAIEKLQPNFNVYMGKETKPFVTIQVKENAATLNLGPGEKSAPALISTNDDFSATPIMINNEQQKTLLTGVPIRIEVRDVKGDFGLNTKRPWSHFETHLKSQTARLTLIGKNGKVYDRRIACCKPEPVENEVSYTPEITLQEAIPLAFGGKNNGNGGISFVDKDITFDKNSCILLDETTERLVNSKDLTNVMSMQLRPGMGIMIYETKPTPETTPTKQAIILDMNVAPANSLKVMHWIAADQYAATGLVGKCILPDSGPFWSYFNPIKKLLQISKGYPKDGTQVELQSEVFMPQAHFDFDGTYFIIKLPSVYTIRKGEVLRVSYIDAQSTKHVMFQLLFDGTHFQSN